MSVKQYSLSKDGNKRLSKNFRVREFRCKDGSDVILIDSKLINVLQHIRNKLGVSLTITSGYRTPGYNQRIGGSSNSMHTKGMAADVTAEGIDPIIIAYIANEYLDDCGGVELGSYGVGNTGYVHIDVRPARWRAIKAYSNKPYVTYPNIFSTIRYGVNGQIVQILMRKFIRLGITTTVTASTTCTKNVVSFIKTFQTKYGLTADGIFGAKSWSKLIEVLRNENN